MIMVEQLVNFADFDTDALKDGSNRLQRLPKREEWAARVVISLVACATDTEASALCGARRGLGRVSCARQICMYLLHTWFGISYKHVGEIFGRDRTTVAHACRQIEALRDRIGVDRRICRLESILELIAGRHRPTR
jgi:chromosomal replication initiation ATPase DnaA